MSCSACSVMLPPEFLVVATCVLVLVLAMALTAITQLNLDVRWVRTLAHCVRRLGRPDIPPLPAKPGRGARRTRKKWRRLAEEKRGEGEQGNSLPIVESSFQRYEDHLKEQREQKKLVLRVQLQNINSRTLEFPCSRCGLVNAKRSCSYSCCASCCRNDKSSVCRAHGTGYQAAVSAVDVAVQHQVLDFDLSYAQLRNCPPLITAIGSQLVSLNLSNNRLTVLPEDIGSLHRLQELFLQYNCLTQLPDSICSLMDLVELDVKNNRLREIPEGIGGLVSLVILSLTNNTITRLPRSIGRLKRIEELSLHSNRLSELPDEICQLTNLRMLYSGENHLEALPSQFGDLANLEELDLSGCELVSLPESMSQCVALIRLWVSNNRLVSLPLNIGDLQQLKELHVRHNKLKCLPASVEQLHLYTFTAQNNCFIDDGAARALCRVPQEAIPPLLEIAARAVLRHAVSWEEGDIPRVLDDMLCHPSRCSRCGGPFFSYYSSHVTFKTIGVFFRVPLYQQFCSPHRNNNCS